MREHFKDETLGEDCEDVGSGVNEYVHYVTHDVGEEWQLLPVITR